MPECVRNSEWALNLSVIQNELSPCSNDRLEVVLQCLNIRARHRLESHHNSRPNLAVGSEFLHTKPRFNVEHRPFFIFNIYVLLFDLSLIACGIMIQSRTKQLVIVFVQGSFLVEHHRKSVFRDSAVRLLQHSLSKGLLSGSSNFYFCFEWIFHETGAKFSFSTLKLRLWRSLARFWRRNVK